MAYYIAENDTHFVVRSEQKVFSPVSGELTGKKRRVFAKFARGCPDWAVSIAEAQLVMKMKPEEYSTQRWAAFYDSGLDQHLSGWTDEEREAIEAKLDGRPGVIKIEKQKAAPPFENYAKLTTTQGKRTIEHVIEKVQEFVNELGVSPETILAYERDNPRKESEAIIAALSKLEQVETEEEAEPLVAA